jgi:hypothetical protein
MDQRNPSQLRGLRAKERDMTKTETINGQVVQVKVCKPSRRRAAGSIQRARYQKDGRGAKWEAREAGQFVDRE